MSLDRLGVLKTSLLDYPGRLSAVLFTYGCNLRCPWCHNPGLVRGGIPQDFWPRSQVLEFLRTRKKLLGAVVVTGGEPLYHQDLEFLLEELLDLGYSLKLDTNGTYPKNLAKLSGLVDLVAMDLKCAPSRYHVQGIPGMMSKIVESVSLIQEYYPQHLFRTTWVPGLNMVDEIREMAQILGPGETLWLTGFRAGKTLNPLWQKARSPTAGELDTVRLRFEQEGIHVVLQQ